MRSYRSGKRRKKLHGIGIMTLFVHLLINILVRTCCWSHMAGEEMGGWNEPQLYQNVIVMRHGPRLDNFDKNWTMATEHPWNPPLYDGDEFKNLYSKTAKKIREEVGAPIHRVIVSPFLRCLQTASRTIQALSSHDSHQQVLLSSSSNAAAAAHIRPSEIRVSFSALLYESVHRIIVFRFLQFLNIASRTIKALFFHDSHQIKASVEYGLAEMMNKKVIWVPPKDGDFKFLIPECEAQLPPEILRHNTIEKVYEKLPEWEETKEVAWNRYNDIVRTLADKYPRENLLLVTHAEGVVALSSTFMNGTRVRVDYCGYVHLRRPITNGVSSFSRRSTINLMLQGQSGITLREK
ncbi:unnamed protein product [Cuscuta europaea]|uniref:Uncharacterized protein n=1 Tax=Cuscuta europaea TaxID=41803 RepID=A0A9P0ZER1_CUSEU|nr:unnamed protein product [Cuscuta europaea]